MSEEPSYIAFARAHSREGFHSPPSVVRELVARIDRDAKTIAKLTPRTITAVEELHGLPLGSVIIDSDPSVLQMLEKSAIGGAEWAQPNEERIYSSGHVTLPATVLYEPTA